MRLRIILGFLMFFPMLQALAAGPQSDPQIYSLISENADQIVMLTDRIESRDKEFARFEDHEKIASKFFSEGQDVWLLCDKEKNRLNQISKIRQLQEDDIGLSVIILKNPTECKEQSLLSNHPIPEQRWSIDKITEQEDEVISKKFGLGNVSRINAVQSEEHGRFFIVHDSKIESIYKTGGYRLLDSKYRQISETNQGSNITPLIDLNGDTVPEFFVRSTDGVDSWIVTMFPDFAPAGYAGKSE